MRRRVDRQWLLNITLPPHPARKLATFPSRGRLWQRGKTLRPTSWLSPRMPINSRKAQKRKDKWRQKSDNGCVKNIIELYCTICQCNDSRFLKEKQRLSNNNCPKFTDDELITVYLWGLKKQLFTRKAIYNYVKEEMHDYFPDLPSYQAFCRRLNRLAGAFRALAEIWSEQAIEKSEQTGSYVLDSCPIMLAKDSRSNHAKVGTELCNLTRNSTRNQWYHGVKLHIFGLWQTKKLPVPCAMHIAPASFCDLWAAKQIIFDCEPIRNGKLYADRAYIDASWQQDMKSSYNIDVITPRKKKKNEYLISGDAFSTSVSSVRQPIESFFNWLNVKTSIQSASHIRSLQGLFFHVFSALAFANLLISRNYFNY